MIDIATAYIFILLGAFALGFIAVCCCVVDTILTVKRHNIFNKQLVGEFNDDKNNSGEGI